MGSVRNTWVAAVAVLVAVLVGAPAAPAAPAPGVGGYVSDADTGIGLGQSTVTWNGTTTPTPTATADPSGRYVFYGLSSGEKGGLAVAGPPGWDRVTLDGIVVPDTGVNVQNVALHRDWASIPGGAQISSNDESVAGAGCPSTAAVDSDKATGWSASASRPAADPPTVTVTLPQTVDVSQFVLDAGAVCGHPAGAALGRYRIETSTDGSTWATALEGQLGGGDRGTPAAKPPTANGGGVRYVRLTALSAQDPTAATIDLRELQVFGLRPNLPPTGTVASQSPPNYVKGVVHLKASFTDPDSSIVHYLWDFDGDGTWDQATTGPAVDHVWAGPGLYHVAVGARDFRGALGTATLDLRIVDPNAPLEPIPQRKPLITFDPPTGIDLPTRIACASKCVFTAKMVVTAKMARKLGLKHRTVFTLKRSTEGPGLGSWKLSLPQKTIKRVRAAHLRKLTVRLTASAIDQQKRRSTVHHWVTFR